MEFGNTKWDVRDWSEEQKVWFQEKCFGLGYTWFSQRTRTPSVIDNKGNFYFLGGNGLITSDIYEETDRFKIDHRSEKTWEDMFPTPNINVVEEIISMVFPEEEEEEEEEVNPFDALVFTQLEVVGASISLTKLSEDQLNFLMDKFELKSPKAVDTHITFQPECHVENMKLNFTGNTRTVYYTQPIHFEEPCFQLGFNDFFKEEE